MWNLKTIQLFRQQRTSRSNNNSNLVFSLEKSGNDRTNQRGRFHSRTNQRFCFLSSVYFILIRFYLNRDINVSMWDLWHYSNTPELNIIVKLFRVIRIVRCK